MLREICSFKSSLNFDDPEIDKAYDVFMINRYISTMEVMLPVVNDLNRYKIPKSAHYLMLKTLIPRGSYTFDGYPKKETNKEREQKIACLCKCFEIGRHEAEIYIRLIPEEKMSQIIKEFSVEKNHSRKQSTV
jgi:hypothetical protein